MGKKDEISSKHIASFQEIMREWPGNGHDIYEIANHYRIDLQPDEVELIEELSPFMLWAGRFPFPWRENEVLEYENGKSLSLPAHTHIRVGNFINRQKTIMGYE